MKRTKKMSDNTLLKITGEVESPIELSFDDLTAIDPSHQIQDVSSIDPNRKGDAVQLRGLLELTKVRANAKYIGLHASTDNFHASIPLEPVHDRAIVIYRLNDQPLDTKAGGPVRFFIPNFAACHTDEIDECANVKFVDHIELTIEKGYDNRPEDDESHEELHRDEAI